MPRMHGLKCLLQHAQVKIIPLLTPSSPYKTDTHTQRVSIFCSGFHLLIMSIIHPLCQVKVGLTSVRLPNFPYDSTKFLLHF